MVNGNGASGMHVRTGNGTPDKRQVYPEDEDEENLGAEDSPLVSGSKNIRADEDSKGDDNMVWVCLGAAFVLAALTICIIFATGGRSPPLDCRQQ